MPGYDMSKTWALALKKNGRLIVDEFTHKYFIFNRRAYAEDACRVYNEQVGKSRYCVVEIERIRKAR